MTLYKKIVTLHRFFKTAAPSRLLKNKTLQAQQKNEAREPPTPPTKKS